MGRSPDQGKTEHLSPQGHAGGIGWPDWSDSPVAIIASGPSAKKANIAALRGRAKIIAIKESFDLCPWADAVYGCDAPWWRYRRGLPEFSGLKISWAGNSFPEWPEIRKVAIAQGRKAKYAEVLIFNGESIGGGGNSGFQAINVAVSLMKARRIILVGLDMNSSGGVHWYGRNRWALANNPGDTNFHRWKRNIEASAPLLAMRGIEIVNASPASSIECFPKRSIEDALQGWE